MCVLFSDGFREEFEACVKRVLDFVADAVMDVAATLLPSGCS